MTRQDASPSGKDLQERRALDRWARNQGYADFDTYIRIGGSIAEARADIGHRIAMLESARGALGGYGDTGREAEDAAQHDLPAIGPDALASPDGKDLQAAAEADAVGEPVDPDNAQIQGFASPDGEGPEDHHAGD